MHYLVLVCDGVRSPANVGSLFRLADAFGVQEIIFCNAEIDLTSTRLRKTARSTENLVPWSTHADILECINELKLKNHCMVGLEISEESIPVQTMELDKTEGTCLVIGNEQHGITEEVLQLLDYTVHVEMFGINSSMNVSHAAGIALYELTKTEG